MNFLELVKHRQSDRAYSPQEIEPEKLNYILEAARLSPSACNAQPWKVIVVTGHDKRVAIADATASKVLGMNHFTKQAPVQLVVVEESANFTSTVGGWMQSKRYQQLDLGIITAHISLAAADQGLGSCIIGWFDEKKIRKTLNIPKNKHVAMVIMLGYSTQNLREKKRKSIETIVSYNEY